MTPNCDAGFQYRQLAFTYAARPASVSSLRINLGQQAKRPEVPPISVNASFTHVAQSLKEGGEKRVQF